MGDLIAESRHLLQAARAANDRPDLARVIDDAAARLDGPVRVAVAGRVKAGKSTLVNAMVGELVAPTDARECTRIVTWYRDGTTYQVEGIEHDGTTRPLRFDRDGGSLEIDLGTTRGDDLDRIEVSWPSRRLRDITLVDTPGLGSISAGVSERTERLLADRGERAAPTDAVLYLLRHVHASDVRFLEAFHDDRLTAANPVNAIGVLSRADEIGVARPDALESAARIAARWRTDRRLGALVQTVLPVAGLLAETASTLRQAEHAAIATIAGADGGVVDEMLMSVDRFAAPGTVAGVPSDERAALLERLGLFGCRLAIDHVRSTERSSASTLAAALLDASGLPALRRELTERFARRGDLLKARSALLTVRQIADEIGDVRLANDVERVTAGAHELAELRLMDLLRREQLTFDERRRASAIRLLGEHGLGITARSGCPDGDDPAALRAALLDDLDMWQREVEHPLADPAHVAAAHILVRTCEGLLAALS